VRVEAWKEDLMSTTPTPATRPAVPPEVLQFAAENGVSEYLYPVMELASSIFPGRPLTVLLEGDPEIADDWHIVFEVDTRDFDADQLLAAQRRWTGEKFRVCPAPHVCVFRLGMS
jgi:hypothetical protein